MFTGDKKGKTHTQTSYSIIILDAGLDLEQTNIHLKPKKLKFIHYERMI